VLKTRLTWIIVLLLDATSECDISSVVFMKINGLHMTGQTSIEGRPIGKFTGQCVEDYETEARRKLDPAVLRYIDRGTETESTLRRNVSAYSSYHIRRRVLHGVTSVDLRTSFFDGKITSETPFFPAPVNLAPLLQDALLYELKLMQSFSFPLFISHLSIVPPIEVSSVPSLVKKKKEGASLIWQIYIEKSNYDLIFKQAERAKSWGYSALTLTVDAELSVKLGNDVQTALTKSDFVGINPRALKKLRKATTLPLIVKGVMTSEDAELAIECGADGVVISNHGGRTLDQGQSSLDVLPEIVKRLKQSKKTRSAEIFLDGGIRRGTDILKALALGANGCLIGRPILWSIGVDPENGPSNVISILRGELERAAILAGISKISKIKKDVVVRA
jgi:isopentenyl diphosphate isomerase/L-lactate dehydrogenase-like FMN-dependent dehydrogenase